MLTVDNVGTSVNWNNTLPPQQSQLPVVRSEYWEHEEALKPISLEWPGSDKVLEKTNLW